MFDPFNIFFKSSRYWLVKNITKLLTSGTRRVEFTDFWMGDQFCSLVFTLSNLYLFACSYTVGFENWHKCGSTANTWPAAFILAMLPFLIRLIQSIKRYVDSKLTTHLINGGKYFCGIIYYLCYYIWRHQGSLRNTSFAFWCLFGALYSVYASAWDFWMDWSLLRPHVNYPFLRAELIYTDHIPFYYFAIISNVLVRFIWVIYIPSVSAPNMYLRLFIAGFLEMLRRWQWNFVRLENEHLGNMDQYRVTREVPLPYSFDDNHHHVGDTDDD
ncbi:EXS-domain-containing protein [Lentinula raphanica]|uniref:EXS-domain-containing protein n=1 Tax=Lentinula raphanica TaxID=153919 RepID=A0AA38P7Z5_9AGAR|nr:EXS-domain-containing protein [Lentinula raphanica]KAJ3969687.1 EXS-domain-containing protein [Lentinula raphanica]